MTFENINEAQLHLLEKLIEEGSMVETRGYKTLELSPAIFSIINPIDRITTISGRNWNHGAAVGELIWHLSGSKESKFISSYLKQWANYSIGGDQISGSCYGHKIFDKPKSGLSQWEKVVDLLKTDLYSRRAVLYLNDDETDIAINSPDVPCASTLQFLFREEKLRLIVNMRSNDIIWGLPYDFFIFTFLQELLAKTLNIPVGMYIHIAGSLHLYEKHFSLANRILKEKSYTTEIWDTIPGIEDLNLFISLEKKIRSELISTEDIAVQKIDNYWKKLLLLLISNKSRKIA